MKKTFFLFIAVLLISGSGISQNVNFAWAKQFASTTSSFGYTNIVDGSGNVYTAGTFGGTCDFNPGPGVFNLTASGSDIFITKLDASGNFLWAKKIGGPGNDGARQMIFDIYGNIIFTGLFRFNIDFDPGPGVYTLNNLGNADAFVASLDPLGNFLWAFSFGGALDDNVISVTSDGSGNLFIGGYFTGTPDFDPGVGTANLTATGFDGYVSKFDALHNFSWVRGVTGINNETVRSVSLDGSGNILVGGAFTGTPDFDPGAGTYNLTSAGFGDVFAAKFDPSGNLIWAKRIGGTGEDRIGRIFASSSGSVYVAGYFQNTPDFDPGGGTFNLTSNGSADIFYLKLDASGNFVWAKQMGGLDQDETQDMIIDDKGGLYGTGSFQLTTDFDPGPGVYNITAAGSYEGFLLKLDTLGNFLWAKTYGGSGWDDSFSVFKDASGNIYSTGRFETTADFDPGPGTFNMTPTGTSNVYILKLAECSGSVYNITTAACDSYTSPSGNHTWAVDGTYLDTLSSIYGCDSILSITLTINTETFSSVTASACDSYTLNGTTYNTSGTFNQTLTNAGGCDSTLTLNLTLRNSTASSLTASACESYTLNGTTYNASGTFTQTLTNAEGCDSIITLNLTINDATFNTITTSTCNSYFLNGTTYNNSGTYTQMLTNAAGCDSTLTLNLTINTNTSSTITTTECDDFILNGTTYNTSGTYSQTIANASGCDSSITLNLTIKHSTSSSLTTSACDSYTLNGTTYISSGTFTQTLTNADGCDSTIMLNLTINNATFNTITTSACDSYFLNGTTYNASGTFTQTLTNANGCDSVLTLELTINNATFNTITTSTCDSYTLNGTTYNTSGTYNQTLTNVEGCDSTITLNLTIRNSTSSSLTASACDSYTLNGTTYNASGTFTQTLTNADGCDSTITLNLTINNATFNTITTFACDSYFLNGTTYTSSGTYTQMLTNAAGCDSTITLNLTINNSTSSTITTTECDDFILNGTTYNTSGTYTQTIPNASGCDSTITLNLTIKNSTSSTLTTPACDSYTLNGTTYTSSGTFTQTLTNAVGCDSILTLNLTINTVNIGVTNTGTTATANATGATYQWVNCDSGFAIVPGATAQSFTPFIDGNYAVIVTQNSCTDTSACEFVISAGISEQDHSFNIDLYPNPGTDQVNIKFSTPQPFIQVKIIDVAGRILKEGKYSNIDLISLDADFPSGVYEIHILGKNGESAVKKWVRE